MKQAWFKQVFEEEITETVINPEQVGMLEADEDGKSVRVTMGSGFVVHVEGTLEAVARALRKASDGNQAR